MKQCIKCKIEKAETEFHLRKKTHDVRRTECKVCQRAAMRARRQLYPDKARAQAAASRMKHHAAHITRSSRWNKDNKEKHAAHVRKWNVKNTDKLRGYQATFRARHPGRRPSFILWAKKNPDKKAQYQRNWRKKYPEKINALVAERAAKKIRATPGWTNHVAVGEFYALAAIKTRLTGQPWHVDHIVPLRSPLVCGLHTHYNLAVILGVDNNRKGNRVWPDMPRLEPRRM